MPDQRARVDRLVQLAGDRVEVVDPAQRRGLAQQQPPCGVQQRQRQQRTQPRRAPGARHQQQHQRRNQQGVRQRGARAADFERPAQAQRRRPDVAAAHARRHRGQAGAAQRQRRRVVVGLAQVAVDATVAGEADELVEPRRVRADAAGQGRQLPQRELDQADRDLQQALQQQRIAGDDQPVALGGHPAAQPGDQRGAEQQRHRIPALARVSQHAADGLRADDKRRQHEQRRGDPAARRAPGERGSQQRRAPQPGGEQHRRGLGTGAGVQRPHERQAQRQQQQALGQAARARGVAGKAHCGIILSRILSRASRCLNRFSRASTIEASK
ncbi:hypothetical protein GALL_496160 [mine drainage metagenome]|uniref:Uncharacterized protein n=1 Tax=mine drainage metagenome TaxID=410659 RepID=A0A1J5PMH0_9ZZZZ